MATEASDNPRIAQLDRELARLREKRESASQRVTALDEQILGLEQALDAERAKAAGTEVPADPGTEVPASGAPSSGT